MANSRSRQQGRNRQEGRGIRSHSEGHEEWSGGSRPGFGRGEGDEERFDRNVPGQGRGFGRDVEREEGNGYGRQFESSGYQRGTQTADREFNRGRDEEDWGDASESWNRGGESRVDFNNPSGGFGGSMGSYGSGGQQQSRYGSQERLGSPQYGRSGSFRSSGRHTGRGPKNYQRDDTRIQEDISEQLTRHPDIDPSEVEIMVSDGVVALTGVVESKQVKRMIEDIAESSSGVTDVQNQLRVENGSRSQTSGRFTSAEEEDEDEDESSSRSRRGSSAGRSSGSRRGRSQSTASSSRQAARNKGNKPRQR